MNVKIIKFSNISSIEGKKTITKGKKITIIIASVVMVLVFMFLSVFAGYAISLHEEIKTMNAITKLNDYPLYEMDFSSAKYDLDDMLAYGIDSEEKIFEYMTKTMLGFPIKLDLEKYLSSSACTSFNAITADGDKLFARNFDYEYTPIMVVKSTPNFGYKSISICDLAMVGYAKDYLPDSFFRKFVTLSSIYTPMDGMNEKGLGISVLELPNSPVHQDNGKTDITTSLMIRLVLDRASTIDEALQLFYSYDMHESNIIGSSYHFFLEDAKGDTAIIEYLDSKINVVRNSKEKKFLVAANHYNSAGYTNIGDFEIGKSQERTASIQNAIDETGGIMSEEFAMDVLSRAVMKDIYYPDINFTANTQWSAIYNLSKKTLRLCVNMQYEKYYSFSFK